MNPDSPLLVNKQRASVVSMNLRRRSVFRNDSKASDTDGSNTKLGALSICFIAYFNVCGGPWGTESIISSLGPAPGIAGIFLIAMFWATPLALITAEMSSRFPDNGGYSIWVAEAFGEFWGFQESYWSWVSGVIDNAVYPVLAFHTLKELFGFQESYLAKLLIAILFSIPTFVTLEGIEKGLVLLFIFVLLPFVLFVIHSFLNPVSFSNLLVTNADSSTFWEGLLELLPVLYWNFSGLDCVSTYAGEVRSPTKSYVRGLSYALVLIVATYVLILEAAVVSSKEDDWLSWSEGSLTGIVDQQMGWFFGLWVVLSSLAANFAMHGSELFEDSWQLAGMAEAGLAPTVFSYRSRRYDTPVVAVFLSVVIICVLITLDFKQIIVVNNFFSVLSALLEMFAFLSIRLGEEGNKESEFPHYRVPFQSSPVLFLFVACPVLLGTFILFTSVFDSLFSVIVDAFATALGLAFYSVLKESGRLNYQRQ